MPDPITNAPEGTPLPEALAQDQDVSSFKTVEELVTDYKATKTKASSVGTLEQIPEELRKDPNITKYKSLEELAKGHVNLAKLISAKGVIVPATDAPQEEKDKFYNSLGRPVKPEEYKLSDVELHPKIKEAYTPEAQSNFKTIMHRFGLNNEQVDGLHKWYFENASKAETAREEATNKSMKDGEAKLRQTLGAEYDLKLANAQRLMKKFGGDEAVNALGDLGNHPAIVKMMIDLAGHFSEDQLGPLGDKKLEGANSALTKIKTIMNDTKHPYHNDGPGHFEAVQEMTELYKQAYPEGEAQ